MTESSSIALRASRRKRILALAKRLTDNLESLTLEEIDGEFYWRIVRDDLFDRLTELAGSIAPHLVGAPRSEVFTEAQQQELTQFQETVLKDPRVDVEHRQFLLNTFKEIFKEREFLVAAKHITDQLPPFVWNRFRNRQRIPLREPIEVIFLEGGETLEIRVYSRTVSGTELDAFLTQHIRGRLYFPPDPILELDEDFRARVIAEVSPTPVDHLELQGSMALVQKPAPSSPLETPTHHAPRSFIQIKAPRPLLPEGPLASLYDAIARDQQQWHLNLPGTASKQDRIVAIRTWAIGLLTADGERFTDAEADVAKLMGLKSWTNTRFVQARQTLVTRVPEAKAALYIRAKRTGPLSNP